MLSMAVHIRDSDKSFVRGGGWIDRPFSSREFEDRCGIKFGPSSQNGRREIRLIGRVRETLCLEAKSLILMVRSSAFAANTTVKMIPTIEL